MNANRANALRSGKVSRSLKDDPKSEYKHVTIRRSFDDSFLYVATINRKAFYFCKSYKTEREAAIAADKALIKHGLPPVNILKRI